MSITALMRQFVKARECLEVFGIRDTGDYAEVLVAKALNATRNPSGVKKGFDILCSTHGKVEVRSRTLPRDGRKETRLAIPKEKVGAFAWLAGLLFDPELTVIGGFLLAHDDAVALANQHRFHRIPFERGAYHSNARDITASLRHAQREL